MEKAGIYIHIPFCLSKCGYCNFFSVTDQSILNRCADALKAEIRKNGGISADSVFLGGGTPTVMGYLILDILEEVKTSCELDANSEITVEANPETVTEELLNAYRNAGVNRISFGVQSFCDSELTALSRVHTAEKAKAAVALAKRAGFSNISVDLMLAIPNQTKESLLYSLQESVKLEVTHISLYSLKLEEGTPLYQRKGTLFLADEEEEWEMYQAACDYLKEQGFIHYEISNFAKDGLFCRHNLKYWTLVPYLGFGPSAHSYYNGKRFYNTSDFEMYFNGNAQIPDEPSNLLEEYIMLGLRLKEGIDLKKVRHDTEKEIPLRFTQMIERLIKNNLALLEGHRFHLTEQGFWISNSIITELLTCLN